MIGLLEGLVLLATLTFPGWTLGVPGLGAFAWSRRHRPLRVDVGLALVVGLLTAPGLLIGHGAALAPVALTLPLVATQVLGGHETPDALWLHVVPFAVWSVGWLAAVRFLRWGLPPPPDAVPDDLDDVRAVLARHPRLHGRYVLDIVPRDELATLPATNEHVVEALLARVDGRPAPPPTEADDRDDWAGLRLDRADARAHAVDVLAGGRDVGHLRDTIPRPLGAELWTRFAARFAADAVAFRVDGELGDRAYVFERGVVLVDATRAGVLAVLESD